MQRDVRAWRRGLHQDLVALGRSLADRASEYGEVQLPAYPDRVFAESAELASRVAERLEAIAREAERLAGLLWPDSTEANARSNLRHALWRLRKALELIKGVKDATGKGAGANP